MPATKYACTSSDATLQTDATQRKAAADSVVALQPAANTVKRRREPDSAPEQEAKRQAITEAEILAALKSRGLTVADAEALEELKEQFFQQRTAEVLQQTLIKQCMTRRLRYCASC